MKLITVCTEVSQDLLQCHNGHIGCKACLTRLETCPVCRISLKLKIKVISDENLNQMLIELRHIEKSEIFVQNEQLLNFLKCHYCSNIPTRKPVYVCQTGHWYCRSCSNVHCLKCRTKNLGNRSIFTEKILSKIEKPCRFAYYGCKELIKGLNEHEEDDCFYREAMCLFFHCLDDVSMFEYLDHFKEEHLPTLATPEENVEETWSRNSGCLNIPGFVVEQRTFTEDEFYIRNYLYLRINDNHFVMKASYCPLKKVSLFRTYLIGYPKDAENFMFKLRLFRSKFHPSSILVNVSKS